ncbi:MAG TPA: hypothetical protein VHG08_02270 [Longimicrobium sp.]|nr:hypothetical protein [Longimicrobium sp.]
MTTSSLPGRAPETLDGFTVPTGVAAGRPGGEPAEPSAPARHPDRLAAAACFALLAVFAWRTVLVTLAPQPGAGLATLQAAAVADERGAVVVAGRPGDPPAPAFTVPVPEGQLPIPVRHVRVEPGSGAREMAALARSLGHSVPLTVTLDAQGQVARVSTSPAAGAPRTALATP